MRRRERQVRQEAPPRPRLHRAAVGVTRAAVEPRLVRLRDGRQRGAGQGGEGGEELHRVCKRCGYVCVRGVVGGQGLPRKGLSDDGALRSFYKRTFLSFPAIFKTICWKRALSARQASLPISISPLLALLLRNPSGLVSPPVRESPPPMSSPPASRKQCNPENTNSNSGARMSQTRKRG